MHGQLNIKIKSLPFHQIVLLCLVLASGEVKLLALKGQSVLAYVRILTLYPSLR